MATKLKVHRTQRTPLAQPAVVDNAQLLARIAKLEAACDDLQERIDNLVIGLEEELNISIDEEASDED